MSVDILGTSWDQCVSMVQCCLTRCPQITFYEEKGEPKRNRTEVFLLTSLTPKLPQGQTGSLVLAVLLGLLLFIAFAGIANRVYALLYNNNQNIYKTSNRVRRDNSKRARAHTHTHTHTRAHARTHIDSDWGRTTVRLTLLLLLLFGSLLNSLDDRLIRLHLIRKGVFCNFLFVFVLLLFFFLFCCLFVVLFFERLLTVFVVMEWHSFFVLPVVSKDEHTWGAKQPLLCLSHIFCYWRYNYKQASCVHFLTQV